MAESKTGLTDLVHDLDLEDMNDTGYKRDINVKIINGFYYQNMAYMNDNVRLFADYWMKLYCYDCFRTVENYVIQNAFVYGMCLSRAFEKFQEEMSMNRVSGSLDDWVDSNCRVKKTRAWQLRMSYKLFSPYKKVLRCKLPFIWFVRNGKTVVDYFKSHHEAALTWTHELDCACETCKM